MKKQRCFWKPNIKHLRKIGQAGPILQKAELYLALERPEQFSQEIQYGAFDRAFALSTTSSTAYILCALSKNVNAELTTVFFWTVSGE